MENVFKNVDPLGIRAKADAAKKAAAEADAAKKAAEEARIKSLEDQLTEAKNNIATLKTVIDTDRANTAKIKEETTTVTKRIDATVASASEDLKQQKDEFQKQKQELEAYQNQLKNKAEAEKLHKQRQERLYEAFYDIFDQGDILDSGMIEIFAKACDFSPEFSELFEDLKTAPVVRRAFKQKAHHLEELFWNLLKDHNELETLIDQPMQLAITDER